MAQNVTHTFVSAKADGADATLVRPSNWNAAHTIPAGTAALPAIVPNSGVVDAATGIWWPAVSAIAISTAAIEAIRWTASQQTQLGGALTFGSQVTPRVNGGSTALTFWDNANANERMRLTDGGILALGTTVVTSAVAGDAVLANAKFLRAVNAAGTDTIALINLDASNRVVLASGNSSDILWGKALVALGGGVAPTLGTIGGLGPATAAQNSWMRAVDNTGAVFWVPAWK